MTGIDNGSTGGGTVEWDVLKPKTEHTHPQSTVKVRTDMIFKDKSQIVLR